MKMPSYKNISSITLVGILVYFFIEVFYNAIVTINAYVFMNFSKIIIILPTLIVLICVLVVIFYVFMSSKLKREFKAYSIIYIIIGIRICTQFVNISSLIFVFNFIMFFILLIFFIGIV